MTRRNALVFLIVSLILIFAALFFYFYRQKIGRIISPFLIAVIVAYLLKPLVAKLEQKDIPRGASILLIYAGGSLAIVLAGIFIVPELVNNTRELLNTLPNIVSGYQDMLNGIISSIRSSRWSGEIKEMIFKEIQDAADTLQTYISGVLKSSLEMLLEAVSVIFDILLGMVVAYYFIKDADFFKSLLFSLIPRRWNNGIIGTGREINKILSDFIQGQLLTALIVGILEVLGLLAVGIKYPLVLGMIGGIANIIPYFGPFIGAIPAVAVALIESPLKALLTILVFVVVQQLENTFISPKIIEGRLGMHPVTTIFVVLAGGEFFGIPGMLLAVPVAAILKAIFKRLVDAIV